MNHKPFVTTELKPLPDAVQELIAERDEWKARCEFSFEQRDKLNAQLKTLQYEVDAIPAIKAERDEYAACADTMAAAYKVERDGLARTLAAIETKVDALIVERDALKAEHDEFNYSLVSTANRKLRSEVDVLRKERDALKDAARLALDVCIEMRRYGNQRSVAMAIGAEAALKAVL